VPLLNKIRVPSPGIPVLTHDPVAARKFAHHVAEEGIVVRAQAMRAATADLEVILERASRERPAGKVFILHGDQDPLANPAAAKKLADTLGDRARLLMIESNNHILEEGPTEQRYFLEALPWVVLPGKAKPPSQLHACELASASQRI
jgi:pimeloyl-ACP methyl ester carboxylesterase